MIHERRHAATASDEPLANDVDVVDVEVWKIGDERVRCIIVREPDVFSVEPLEGAVRADVDDSVGSEALAKPRVGGDVLMVRRQILRVIHLLAVLAPSARGLRQKRDVPELHGRDHQTSIGGHQARLCPARPSPSTPWP